MENKYDFVVDKENKTVSFADKQFNYYKTIKSVGGVLDMFSIYSAGKAGEGYKTFTKTYGITPSNFKKCFNAIMRKVWIEPVEKHVMRYAFTASKKVNSQKLNAIWDNKSTIEQCEKDGTDNIIPFVVSTGMTPQQLKSKMGKSVWKKVTKQSMTRNTYLARGRLELVQNAIDFPSHVLKKGGMICVPWDSSGKWILESGVFQKVRKERFQHRELNNALNLYRDTERMASQLGKKFCSSWTPEKMKEKHEDFTRLVMLKKYSPEPFEHLKEFSVNNIRINDVVAELCNSPLAVREEGEVMHHCVGSYADYVARNEYLVYSIKKNGVRSSTLGVWVEDGKYRFSQHYGYCNKRVEDAEEIEVVSLVMEQLNKLNKGEE